MAQINATFDTVTKKLTVSVDGNAIENVVGMGVNRSWDDEDEYGCYVATMVEDEETDIKTSTTLYATETVKAKAALLDKTGEEAATFPGFVQVKSTEASKVHSDIADFLKK